MDLKSSVYIASRDGRLKKLEVSGCHDDDPLDDTLIVLIIGVTMAR